MSNATAYERNAPAFPMYADDFFSGTRDMSCEEVGVYMRLLTWQWTKGPIPDDKRAKVERYVGADWVLIESVLAEKFAKYGSEWRNERLETIRIEQAERREKKSDQARQAANKRWGNDADSNADAYAPAMRTQCIPSPSPSPRWIDIDIDHLDFDFVEQMLSRMRKVMPPAANRGDKRLAWCAAVLATKYSENWLVDSLEGVRSTSPKKPWAYLTRCLRTKAMQLGFDFDQDKRRVPERPAELASAVGKKHGRNTAGPVSIGSLLDEPA